MFRIFAVAVALIVALFASPGTSSAAGITFVESTYGLNFGCVGAGCLPVDGLSNAGCNFCYSSITNTNVLAFSQTFSPVPPFFATYNAQAQTSPGSLHASASVDYSRSPTATDSRFLYASSIYRELLTVNSATLQGQAGTLTIVFNLDGTISESGSGNALAYVGLQAGTETNPEAYAETFSVFQSSFDGSVQLTVPIVYGQEFLLSAALGAFAGSVAFCPTCPLGVQGYAATGVGGGSANFFNTLELAALIPTSSASQFVADARFASGSGTEYGFTGVVPEPGTFMLLGTGLALAALRLRRRSTK